MGELSHARQALEGAALAPGKQATLDALQDPERKFMPATLFELDEKLFNRNLRSSRRSAAAGPSGMTMEHLRPLLDEPGALHFFFLIGEKLAHARARQRRGSCPNGEAHCIVQARWLRTGYRGR